ncbi:HAMP domain-containing protein [Nonomuraea antimicrobica]
MITRVGRSLRARLALLASVAMAVLCLAASGLLLWSARSTIMDIRTREIIGSALRLAHQIQDHRLPSQVSMELNGLQVVDASGRVVSSTPNLTRSPRLSRLIPAPDQVSSTGRLCGRPEFEGECQTVVSFRVDMTNGDWYVYAFDPEPPWYISPAAIAILAGTSMGLVALTWFGVSRVVAKTLAPVNRITERLAEITASDIKLRVPVPENADEIRALAQTANQTLTRLEEALEQQRRFSSDASHDLRSPITAMRAELEEALISPARPTGARPGASC